MNAGNVSPPPPQVEGVGAAHAAAEKGNAPALRQLLRLHPELAFAKSSSDGGTPLHAAAGSGARGALECAEALLESGALVNAVTSSSDRTPLHAAAEGANEAVMRLLLANGARAKAARRRAGTGGVSPLHLAARTGSVECLRALLEHGADPHEADGVRSSHCGLLSERRALSE